MVVSESSIAEWTFKPAKSRGHLFFVKALCSLLVDPNSHKSALIQAAANDHLHVVQYLRSSSEA